MHILALHLSLHVSNYRFPVIIDSNIFSVGVANLGGKRLKNHVIRLEFILKQTLNI